jgi:hypothetical protein
MKKSILFIFSFFLFLPGTFAIGYGGIGGEPAFPRDENPRSESIFIHTLGPGSIISEGVRVINNTDETKNIRIYSVDSEIASGGKFACSQFSAQKTSVGSWIAIEDAIVSLESKTNTVVPFQITVPESASPGEHNGCIVIEELETSESQKTGINLRFRTGIRVAITVPGEIKQEVVFLGLSIDKKKIPASYKSSLLVKPRLMNVGNVSVDTRVVVAVKSPFGRLIEEQNSVFTVPGGEQTDWNFEIPAPFWGGWYKVEPIVGYQKQFFSDRAIAENPSDDSSSDLSANLFDADGGNLMANMSTDDILVSGSPKWFFVMPSLPALIIESAGLSLLVFFLLLWRISVRRKKWIRDSWEQYTAKASDDLKSLAKEFDVSWKLIARVNELEAPYSVKRGQKLLLPPRDES